MNDKKTTYDKLVKHIDKAQRFIDILASEHIEAQEDPRIILERAMENFALHVGDRHSSGLAMQGMAQLYIDRSRLQKPMTSDEIHAMNQKSVDRGKELAKEAEERRLIMESEKRQVELLKEFIDTHSKPQIIWLIEDAARNGFDLVKTNCQPLGMLAKFLAEFFSIGELTPPDVWGYPKGCAADVFYTELMQDIYSNH